MNKPAISIIIPVYNMAPYIDETVSSWINQTLKSIELIYIDDCSSDGSLEKLKEWSEKDSRIHVYSFEKNKSAWSARLLGVREARGKYIMFADADDTIIPSACRQLYAELKKNPVDILHFGTEVINAGNRPKETIKLLENMLLPYQGSLYGDNVFSACFCHQKYGYNLWNKLYSAEVCKKALQDQTEDFLPRGQDKLMYFMISYYARSYRGIKKKYYNYYYGRGMHGVANMNLEQFERLCSMSKVAEKQREFLEQRKREKEYEDLIAVFRSQMVDDCVGNWLDNLNTDVKAEGFDLLMSYWKPEEIIPALSRGIKNQTYDFAKTIVKAKSIQYKPHEVKTVASYYYSMVDGGIERVVAELSELWVEMGYRVILFTDESPSPNDYETPPSVERIIVPNHILSDCNHYGERAAFFIDIIRKKNIDVLVYHAFDAELMFWDALSVKSAGCAFIGYSHNICSLHMFATLRPMEGIIAPYIIADCVVTLSEEDAYFWRHFNTDVVTVLNPMIGKPDDWEQSRCAGHDILWLARIADEKSPMDLPGIMELVLKEVPDARLHIVGKSRDERYYKRFLRSVKESGVEKSIVLHGFAQDVKPYYQNASIFLLTSKYEGFSLTLQESMLAGLPIVMYELPYLTLVNDNPGIISVRLGDKSATAEVLISLLKDDQKRKKLGEESREYVNRIADYDYVRAWKNIFAKISIGHQIRVPDAASIMMETLIKHHDWGILLRTNSGTYENAVYLDRKTVKMGVLAAKTIDSYRDRGFRETIKRMKERISR